MNTKLMIGWILLNCTMLGSAFGQEAAPAELPEPHRVSSDSHGELEIVQFNQVGQKGVILEVTYRPKGGTDASHHSQRIVFKDLDDETRLEFKSLVDRDSGDWCVYDTSQAGFIFMATVPTPESLQKGAFRNFWHPGIHIGWGRGFWAGRYRAVKGSHDDLPYKRFVSEKPVIGAATK